MKILVTGAAGFIGSNMVDFLVERGHEVCALDNFSTGNPDNLVAFKGPVEVVDVQNHIAMEKVFDKFPADAVLHLAAQSAITTAWQKPSIDLIVNGMGTLSVLQKAKEAGVKKFVFSSTSAVYGKGRNFGLASKETDRCNPDTPYGISKLAAENYIRLLFPNYVILRYGNVYGPRQQPIGQNQVIARAFRHFHHGDEFKVVGDGEQKRDFIYVEDICWANYLALTGSGNGTFNVASGNSYSVNQVLGLIANNYEVPEYKWEHTNEPDARGDVFINADKFKKKFDWRPFMPIGRGLLETSEYWQKK